MTPVLTLVSSRPHFDFPTWLRAMSKGHDLLEEKGGPIIEDDEILNLAADAELAAERYGKLAKGRSFWEDILCFLKNPQQEAAETGECLDVVATIRQFVTAVSEAEGLYEVPS